MLPFTLINLLLAASFTAAESQPCLGSAEAANIALRWLEIFQTNSKGAGTGSAIVPSTITPDFLYYDEGSSFGNPAPVYNNRSQLLENVSGTGYTGTLVTDVKYTVLHTFASCDTIGLRWLSQSKAAKAKGVTVAVGTPVTYKGNDYLLLDLDTRMIKTVWSSSDLTNWYIGLGDDIIKQKLEKSS